MWGIYFHKDPIHPQRRVLVVVMNLKRTPSHSKEIVRVILIIYLDSGVLGQQSATIELKAFPNSFCPLCKDELSPVYL